MQPTREEAIRLLADQIKDIEVAMLTTLSRDGSLHSRPMVVPKSDFDGSLWFITGAGSGKVMDIQQDDHVNVCYVDPVHHRYVSVSGRASLLRDRARSDQLWTSAFQSWFPQGKDDPSLSLLRVDVESAEYWDSSSGDLVSIFGFVKAVVTGHTDRKGEHHTVDL